MFSYPNYSCLATNLYSWIADLCVEHHIPFVLGHALYQYLINVAWYKSLIYSHIDNGRPYKCWTVFILTIRR